jgi:hypothetical protein
MPLLIWLGMKLIPVWNALGKAASAGLSFARAKPHLAVIIALVGISGLLWCRLDHVKDERDAARSEIAAMGTAMNKAVAASKRIEKASKELANAADNEHALARGNAMAAADRYISTHRVREACPVRASTSPESGGASLPERVPTGGLVVVTDADVRACSAATAYAIDSYRWAAGIEALQESELPAIY